MERLNVRPPAEHLSASRSAQPSTLNERIKTPVIFIPVSVANKWLRKNPLHPISATKTLRFCSGQTFYSYFAPRAPHTRLSLYLSLKYPLRWHKRGIHFRPSRASPLGTALGRIALHGRRSLVTFKSIFIGNSTVDDFLAEFVSRHFQIGFEESGGPCR